MYCSAQCTEVSDIQFVILGYMKSKSGSSVHKTGKVLQQLQDLCIQPERFLHLHLGCDEAIVVVADVDFVDSPPLHVDNVAEEVENFAPLLPVEADHLHSEHEGIPALRQHPIVVLV